MKTIERLVSAAARAGGASALAALFGVALAGLPGIAGAAGTDRITPVQPAPDAPGMIRFDSCSRPVYPEREFKDKHEGTTTLRLLIGADGKVKDGRVVASSGYRALDQAALAGLSKCSFHPPMADGKPVEAWTHFQYVWTTQ